VAAGTGLDDAITAPAAETFAVSTTSPVAGLRSMALGAELVALVEVDRITVNQVQLVQVVVVMAGAAAQRLGVFEADVEVRPAPGYIGCRRFHDGVVMTRVAGKLSDPARASGALKRSATGPRPALNDDGIKDLQLTWSLDIRLQ